jgi:hypothetical protein
VLLQGDLVAFDGGYGDSDQVLKFDFIFCLQEAERIDARYSSLPDELEAKPCVA